MLAARVLTVVVLLPPVLAAIFLGGPLLAALLVAAGLLAGWEAAGLVEEAGRAAAGNPAGRHRGWIAAGGAVPALAAAVLPLPPGAAILAGALAWPLLVAAVLAIPSGPSGRPRSGGDTGPGATRDAGGAPARHRGTAPAGSAATAAGPARPGRPGDGAGRGMRAALAVSLWVGAPLAHALWLRERGALWLLAPLLIIWAQDIAAFFAGRALGRRPLAPRLSPAKTWEGAAAGLAAGLAVAGALAVPLHVPATVLLPVAAVVAVAGQLGDLYESGWKRRAGRKDSGALLPGHGGMLDRIDSLLFALPLFTWWAVTWR